MAWEGGILGEIGATPIALEFALDSYPGPAWEVSPLRHRSGWLSVSVATMETPFSSWSAPLVACVNDDCETISTRLASKLFEMRCSLPREVEDIPPVELEGVTDALYWDFLGTCDLKHLAMLEEREADAERQIERLETRGRKSAFEVDAYVTGLRRSMRRGEIAPENMKAIEDRIALVQLKLVDAESWLRRRIASIRAGVSEFEEDVFGSLHRQGEVEHLYSVHWRVKPIRERRVDRDQLSRRWTYEQKLYASADHVERSFSPYQRLHWLGPEGADSRRCARPVKISLEEREAIKATKVIRRPAATPQQSFKQAEAWKREREAGTDARRAEQEVQLALATPKRPKTEEEVDAFLAEMERKREHALKQRAKRTAYQLKKALADQVRNLEPSPSGPAESETAEIDDISGDAATADALQVVLDEQRRLVELVKRWREDQQAPRHDASEQDLEESR